MIETLRHFVACDDPLCDSAVALLLNHKEEDEIVDYKEDFDCSDKEWLGITCDVMAFANTHGGYLVFGVTNSFAMKGLRDEVASTLSDTAKVLDKLNRYVQPQFLAVRTKRIESEGKTFVVIHIPETIGHTHIVTKEASIQYATGKPQIFLRPGTIYVRRPARNQVITPADLDFILDKRLTHFRATLLKNIATVVEAPAESRITVVTGPDTTGKSQPVILSNSPAATPVRGLSFTTPPETDEQMVAGWIALAKRDQQLLPSYQEMWTLYARREGLKLSKDQEIEMARAYFLREMPVFFWLQHLNAEDVQNLLDGVFESKQSIFVRNEVMRVAAFLGPAHHGRMVARLDESEKRHYSSTIRLPPEGPRGFYSPKEAEQGCKVKGKGATLADNLLQELNSIAENMAVRRGGVMERRRARILDCSLYARDDYRSGK